MDPDALANAFRRQAKNVQYADYKPKEDFPLWLAGYKEKVKSAYGYTAAQENDLKTEVARSISGKLQSGPALDAYQRLTQATKDDYDLLTKALTKEFIDPQVRNRFLDNLDFNKRKKDQTLKEFIQEIKRDQDRYSGMAETVMDGGRAVPNPDKMKDGIRRFKKGIRDRNGKVDKDQARHLRYNIMDDTDYSWENALMVASRWEEANHGDTALSSSSSSSSSEDEPLEAVECSKKKKGKVGKKEKVVINALDVGTHVATLAEKVETNARDIKGVKSEQERLNANITSWKSETTEALNQMPAKLVAAMNQQGTSGNSYNRGYQNRNPQRPNSYVWKGRFGQNQQSGFRFNRNSPQNFKGTTPTTTASTTPTSAATAAATAAAAAAAASTAAAALEEVDPAAQLLGAEGGDSVVVPMDQFLELSSRAGLDIDDEDFIAALSHLNFQ